MIFKIFHFFIYNNYTAIDRELLRTFLETIEPILKKYLFRSDAVNAKFYLTIMEKELGNINLESFESSNNQPFKKTIPQIPTIDTYYLKEMT